MSAARLGRALAQCDLLPCSSKGGMGGSVGLASMVARGPANGLFAGKDTARGLVQAWRSSLVFVGARKIPGSCPRPQPPTFFFFFRARTLSVS